jgi:hypothetical protein
MFLGETPWLSYTSLDAPAAWCELNDQHFFCSEIFLPVNWKYIIGEFNVFFSMLEELSH